MYWPFVGAKALPTIFALSPPAYTAASIMRGVNYPGTIVFAVRTAHTTLHHRTNVTAIDRGHPIYTPYLWEEVSQILTQPGYISKVPT